MVEPSHNRSDEEMSMAINNVMAMLGIEDVDRAINLLSTNNWDEASAVNAYYAEQEQNQQHQAAAQEPVEPEPQVRAPIEAREDQLIGGPDPDPFMDMQMMQQQMMRQADDERRRRSSMGAGGVPETEAKNYTFESMIELYEGTNEEDITEYTRYQTLLEQERTTNQPGILRRSARFLSSLIFCSDAEEDNSPQTIDTQSVEMFSKFKNDFDAYLVKSNSGQARQLGLKIYDKPLSQLCKDSRGRKKPLIIMVARESDQSKQMIFKTLNSSEAARDILKQYFTLTGINEQIPLAYLKEHLYVPHTSLGVFYCGFVTHDHKIRLMRRLVLRPSNSNSMLFEFVSECKNLFEYFVEEDPQYKQVEMLQNAGIIPVSSGQLARASQPRAQPQSDFGALPQLQRSGDPDALLRQQQQREYEAAQQEDMMRQIEREQQEAQERAEREEIERVKRQQEEEAEIERQAQEALEQAAKERKATLMSMMPDEPAAGTPDVTEISFRVPSGSRVTRRFLKTDTVKLLYDYIRTLDEETVAFDNPAAEFNLMQAMPRKVYEEGDKSLADAGLFPRALLVVQEKEQE